MADCDPGESVHFRVLGPLEVTRGERSIPITAARHQVVLAMLLLEVGRVVSVERLVDALWAEDPSKHGQKPGPDLRLHAAEAADRWGC